MHVVVYSQAGQELVHIPPAYVASADYSIVDTTKDQDDASRVIASGTANAPGYTLTLDDDAGPGELDGTKLPVTATAGPSRGDTCVVIGSDGAFEAFEVGGIETNTHLLATSVLAGTYASGSTVRGIKLAAPVPSALYNFEDALDDQRPLMVVWEYTIGGSFKRVKEPIRLSRSNFAAASIGSAMKTVRRGYPDLPEMLGEYHTLDGIAQFSLEDIIAELATRQIDHQDLMLGDQGRMLLVSKIVFEAARRGYAPGDRDPERFIEEMAKDYDRRLTAIVVGHAGSHAILTDTDERSVNRPDMSYRGPITAL